MTLSEQLQDSVNAWVTSGGAEDKEEAVHRLLDSDEYPTLGYHQKNAAFITAHKLLALENDPFLCKLEYVDLVPKPFDDGNEGMLIGQAVDDLVTAGEVAFQERYAAVARRDKKAEESNSGKVLLTNGQLQAVQNAAREFASRHFFPRSIHKRNFLCVSHGLALKGEVDGWDEAERVVFDLKTCANLNTFIDDFSPGRRFYEKYVFQQATYAYICEKRFGERVNGCALLVCDRYDWCRSHRWTISYATLQQQFFRIDKLLQNWAMYEGAGIWPFTLRLDTLEGLKKLNDSPYYSHPLLKPFKDSIPETIL